MRSHQFDFQIESPAQNMWAKLFICILCSLLVSAAILSALMKVRGKRPFVLSCSPLPWHRTFLRSSSDTPSLVRRRTFYLYRYLNAQFFICYSVSGYRFEIISPLRPHSWPFVRSRIKSRPRPSNRFFWTDHRSFDGFGQTFCTHLSPQLCCSSVRSGCHSWGRTSVALEATPPRSCVYNGCSSAPSTLSWETTATSPTLWDTLNLVFFQDGVIFMLIVLSSCPSIRPYC